MYAAEGDTIMIGDGSVEIVGTDGTRKQLPITSPGSGQALIEDQPMEEQPLMDEDN